MMSPTYTRCLAVHSKQRPGCGSLLAKPGELGVEVLMSELMSMQPAALRPGSLQSWSH